VPASYPREFGDRAALAPGVAFKVRVGFLDIFDPKNEITDTIPIRMEIHLFPPNDRYSQFRVYTEE